VPNGVALAVAALLLILGLAVLRRALDQGKLLRTLRGLEPNPTAASGTGLRLVHGRLGGDPLIQSPYQGRPCVYHFFRVLEPRPGGRPRVLATGKEWTAATVTDDTATAQIEPWTAVVASPRRFEAVHEGLTSIPPHLATFFERAGIDEKHLPRLPSFVVHEYTLEPGDEVYVLGTLDAAPRRFRRAKRRPLVVSAQRDVGLGAALRNEWLLYALLAPLLLAGALALGALGWFA
jgi:hypothetical protein